ncbi:hypothetical protein [Dolichospermum phage Dfl-JY23]
MKNIYLSPDGSKKALKNLDYIGGVGRWYAPFRYIHTTSNVGHTGIGYRFTPFYVRQKIEIDGIGYTQSSGAASGVSKLAIYNCNRTNYKPTTKIIECADFLNNVTGGRPQTITPTILNPGVYFFANIANNTVSFNITTMNGCLQPDMFGCDTITDVRLARKGWIYTTTYVDGSSAISDFTSLHGDLTPPTINNILMFMKVSTLF